MIWHFPMTESDAVQKYGDIKAGVWLDETTWCSRLQIPPDIGANWINTYGGKPVDKIYCNKDFQGPLLQALEALRYKNLLSELHSFDGCFSIRDIRGRPGELSAHSWGIAIDINARENPLGGPSKFSSDFVKCFKDAGLFWGGDFNRCDPMHFSLGF